MKVRSIAIIDAHELKDLTDESILELVKWYFLTGGQNVLTEKHGSHLHIRGKGLEIEIYEDSLPMWLVYSEGNYFAFSGDEFHRYYEPADKHKLEARVTVQTQKEFTEGAAGTVFQALINSGLTRDQALDGLIEIQATGIVFAERGEVVKQHYGVDLLHIPEPVWASRCGRCTKEQIAKYGKSHHETAEHDAWLALHLNKETNPDA